MQAAENQGAKSAGSPARGAGLRRSLHEAARANDYRELQRLLREKGGDVGAKDAFGQSPLHLAARYADSPLLRALLDAGADFEAEDALGQSPLHFAAASEKGDDAVIGLVRKGADVNRPDSLGETPLHHAARNLHPSPALALLLAGASPLAQDYEGETPRDIASRSRLPSRPAPLVALMSCLPDEATAAAFYADMAGFH